MRFTYQPLGSSARISCLPEMVGSCSLTRRPQPAFVALRQGQPVFLHHLDVEPDRLFCRLQSILDGLALRRHRRQLGHENAEAAFGLWRQDDLVLTAGSSLKLTPAPRAFGWSLHVL